MKIKKEEEVRKLFMILGEAEKLHLDGSIKKQFNVVLRDYLKDYFGDDIKFVDKEGYEYISANYKDVDIEIKIWHGIILSVQNKKNANVLKEFIYPLNNIVGSDPICSYNFCSSVDGNKKVYPTIEWSTEPQARLDSLVMQAGNPICTTINDFKDYYLSSAIKELGNELFTLEGYNKIFDTTHSNRILDRHRLQQIQRLNPTTSFDTIGDWYAKYRKQKSNLDIGKYKKY